MTSFIPSLSSAVRFAGAGYFAAAGTTGVLTPDEYNLISYNSERKILVVTSALSTCLIALSIFGLTPIGVASSSLFAGGALASLAGKIDVKLEKAFYLVSSIANLGGGIYSLIALPFSYLNALSALSLSGSPLVCLSLIMETR